MNRAEAINKWIDEIYTVCATLYVTFTEENPLPDETRTTKIQDTTKEFQQIHYIYKDKNISIHMNPLEIERIDATTWEEYRKRYETIKNGLMQLQSLYQNKNNAGISFKILIQKNINNRNEWSFKFNLRPYETNKDQFVMIKVPEKGIKQSIAPLLIQPVNQYDITLEEFIEHLDRALEIVDKKLKWLKEPVPEERWNDWNLTGEELEQDKKIATRKVVFNP